MSPVLSRRGKIQAAGVGVAVVALIAAVVGIALHSSSHTGAAASGPTRGGAIVAATASPTAAAVLPVAEATSAAPVVSSAAPAPTKSAAPPKVVPRDASGTQLDDPNPTLGPVATPAWAQEPPMTTTLHTSKTTIHVYPYTKGVAPTDKKGVLITLNNPMYEGVPLTMDSFGETDGYYLALLDVRPNNTFGWVKASDVTTSTTPYRIEISRTNHRLLLWKNDTVIGSFKVAVGAPATYTPAGYFFVNAILKQDYPAGDYGPWIVSSSGFSEVYTTFGSDGGDAAIGLHGSDEPGSIGYSVSHGCIRMYNSDITLMAHTVPVGTLFEIH